MSERGQLPAISVLLACYNQAPFIAEAVQGILDQRVTMPIEVVVADDSSTDGTREIVARLLRARPDIPVRFLPAEGNLGPVRNYFRGFAACRAPLVALLDGDDYWTHPDKLTAQAQTLQDHPGCAVCATNYQFLDMQTGRRSPRVAVGDATTVLTTGDLIGDNIPGNLSACMYRRAALDAVPDAIRQARCGDWLLNIAVTGLGPLAFLHQPMSVYRRNNGGVWTSLSRAGQLRLLLELVPEYDAATGGAYVDAFARVAAGFRQELDGLAPA